MTNKQTLSGTVKIDVVAKGSKSERQAAILQQDDGSTIILRLKKQGFSMADEFNALSGKTVEATGIKIAGNTFMIEDFDNDIRVLPAAKPGQP